MLITDYSANSLGGQSLTKYKGSHVSPLALPAQRHVETKHNHQVETFAHSHGSSNALTSTQEAFASQSVNPSRTYAAVLRAPHPKRNLSITTIDSNKSYDSKSSDDSKQSAESKTTASSSSSTKEAPTYVTAVAIGLVEHTFVDSDETLLQFLAALEKIEDYVPDMCLDMEGGDGHGRDHSLNTIQVMIISQDWTWVMDYQVLGSKIFDTALPGKTRTFRKVLESEAIPKIWFDARQDFDSLYGHEKVDMSGIIDLQVMEQETRQYSRKYLHGLDTCVNTLPQRLLSRPERMEWLKIKAVGKALCSGWRRYGIFDERPLPRALEQYAVNDVVMMSRLFIYFSEGLGICQDGERMRRVLRISGERAREAKKADYPGNTSASKFGIPELREMGPEYDSDDDY